MTQGAQLIQAIRKAGRRGMTYVEMECLRISGCPWRRLTERAAESALRPGERLERGERDGLVVFRVVRA